MTDSSPPDPGRAQGLLDRYLADVRATGEMLVSPVATTAYDRRARS